MPVRWLLAVVVLTGMAYGQTTVTGKATVTGTTLINYSPDFSLSISPNPISINAGSTANATITITSVGGFASAVTLSFGSGPSGLTYACSPNPVTAAANSTATCTLTITATSGAPATTCPATGGFVVTGTAGTLSHSISPCVIVTPGASTFALNITIAPTGGGNVSGNGIACPGTCTVNLTAGTAVTLTETVQPGFTFTNWTGTECNASASSTCSFTMPSSTVNDTANYSSGGPPLTYSARTDPCVLGTEVGCPNTGTAVALTFLGDQDDPNHVFPWYQTTGVIDQPSKCVTDPDFHSYQCIVTSGDYEMKNLGTATPGNSMSVGADEYDTWSQDSQLLLVQTSGGAFAVVAVNKGGIAAQTCLPNTNICFFPTGVSTKGSDSCAPHTGYHTNCTVLDSGGVFSWSRVPGETEVLYEFINNGLQVNKLPFVCNNPLGPPTWFPSITAATSGPTCKFTRTPYINFTADTVPGSSGSVSAPCSVLPASYNTLWQGSVSVANGGSVGYALGGAPDWQPSTAYSNTTVADEFVYPSVNNAGKFAYQVTGACTSGAVASSAITWDQTLLGTGTTGDPGCSWVNIGKITGQGPGFNMVYFNPTLGCRRLNARTGYLFNGTNEGGNYPSAPSGGTCSTGGAASCSGKWQTDQASALFNSCLNAFDVQVGANPNNFQPNTVGNTWTLPYAQNCYNPPGTNIPASGTLPDLTTIHDGGIKITDQYMAFTPTGGGGIPNTADASHNYAFENQTESCRTNNFYNEILCNQFIFDMTTNIVRPIQQYTYLTATSPPGGVYGQGDAHQVSGYAQNWKGGLFYDHNFAKPIANSTSDTPCYDKTGAILPTCQIGLPFNGEPLLTSTRATGKFGAPWDEHGNDRAAISTDDNPVFVFETAVPALGQNTNNGNGGYPGSTAGYNEILGIATQAVVACSSPAALFCEWRFAHNWGTGSPVIFNAQNEQGVNSQDGLYAAFASDVLGTRGSLSPDWKAGGSIAIGGIINPVCTSVACNPSGFGNNNTSSYQNLGITSCTEAASGSEPHWSTKQNTGDVITDGGCTLTNVSGSVGSGGSKKQLPCNGLRADLQPTNGAVIYLNTVVGLPQGNGNFYEATGNSGACATLSTSVSCTETKTSFTGCTTVGSTCGDNGAATVGPDGILFTFIGSNDCRGDVIFVDLNSAH